ncbi:glycosyltransferase family 2 protein [Pelagovum pacificum]|uniref:Glycosyltransferase family 2 protein n=1 Tax=Pelagovum pacificum TaxID=2588711 RepID=A0A5C5GDC6_9RHOB|nr:glycosyltransferase family 2 protein [Pelagovum pacificum]QQA42456.1 glycosyltransferase family 2 protein [Pelagovum pacificum]TNY31539.1 glycosyltransferase family 2 protein [Pelagovum pacificum]
MRGISVTPDRNRPAVMSCMRDEGAHLLEWLAYHRAVGFGEVVVATNDCSDGTDALLDALAAAGEVTHLRNDVPDGTPPQHSGTALAMAHLRARGAHWVLHIDADEFLNVQTGHGTVDDLLAVAPDADCICIGWRNFGDGGHAAWPGATLPHFTRREGPPKPDESYFKCLFRLASFDHAYAHMPTRPTMANPTLVNAAGQQLKNDQLFADAPRVRFFPVRDALRLDRVAINHYGVKSPDVFTMKLARGRGENTRGHQKYRLGSEWHRRANRNEVEDTTILRHWPATEAGIARLRALPGVAEAEARCLAWFDDRRLETAE